MGEQVNMKNSGYLIERYSNMGTAYTCARLREEAEKKGIKLDIIGVQDISVHEDGIYHRGSKLLQRKFMINRYKWGKIKHELALLGEKSYNNQQKFEQFINKYEQVKNLHSNEWNMPKYCLAFATQSCEEIQKRIGIPFVAKGLESAQGNEVFLIQEQKDMDQLILDYGMEKEWLFQEFIHSSYGSDIRIYSIKGEVIGCMTRTAISGFKANVALGAEVKSYQVTEQIKKIAKDIYEQTSLDFLGIDLLFGEDKPFFCEINVMPGIEGMERATGVNIAEKIISTILGDLINE